MRFKLRRQKPDSFFDIAPIVDTVFNLLIFFAISLNFVSTPAIRVDLPKSSEHELPQEKRNLRVTITRAGEIYLDESKMDLHSLFDQFREAAQSSTQSQVLIQADEQVHHGRVVEIMDLAREGGLRRLAIVTRRKEDRG